MTQAVQTDPPNIPLRSGGWPKRRSPRWAVWAVVGLVGVAISLGLSHHPTPGQRATDLSTFLGQLTYDVQSCSGGVRESLLVLREIDTGASKNMTIAQDVAAKGAFNCSPANNELLDDLTAIGVPESLSSYHLDAAVTALIDWAAPDAAQVQADVLAVLKDHGKPSEAAARTALHQALLKLDAQRSVFQAALAPAIKALSPQTKPPVLYG